MPLKAELEHNSSVAAVALLRQEIRKFDRLRRLLRLPRVVSIRVRVRRPMPLVFMRTFVLVVPVLVLVVLCKQGRPVKVTQTREHD